MDNINYSSVCSLIKDLCENIVCENFPSASLESADVRNLRTKSFEIILKKSKTSNVAKNYTDPLKELDIIQFAARIKAGKDHKKLQINDKNDQILKFISKEPYFIEGYGKDVLKFLLCVKDSMMDYKMNRVELQRTLFIPGPFTLHFDYTSSLTYEPSENKHLKNIEYIKGLASLLDYNNPYLPRSLFETQKNKSLTSILNHSLVKKSTLESFDYHYLRPLKSSIDLKQIENCEKGDSFKIVDDKILAKTRTAKRFGWNWENLGTTNLQIDNKFCSELKNFTPLKILASDCEVVSLISKIVEPQSFIYDLKCLLVGIESESFYLDENIKFHMFHNLTIPGVAPTVIQPLVLDFLECGTSYKRMNVMTLKNNFQMKFEGFIFKALCCAITDYLTMFRQFVYSYTDLKLIEFNERMKKPMIQLSGLAQILGLYGTENSKLQMGSQFLGYIYKEIMRVTQPNMLSLLIFILKRCCHVYFKYLQKWMFLGSLEDPTNELFISFSDNFHPNTKYFFDKAFFIRKESVPGFFQGYEDYILQCGKYTKLLKAIYPNHSVFTIEPPPVKVCLSFGELQKVDEACNKYLKDALKICNEPITVKDIYDKKFQSRKAFFKLVQDKTHRNFENWKNQKKEIASLNDARKKEYFEEMSKFYEEHRLHKINQKMNDIIWEKTLAEQQEEKSIEILKETNAQISRDVNYLKDLNTLMDKRVEFGIPKETDEPEVNDVLKNKSENDQDEKESNQNNDEIFNLDVVNSNDLRGTKNVDIQNRILTDAERNKIRVMCSDSKTFQTECRDLNSNYCEEKSKKKTFELTAMEQNKIKMMQSDPFKNLDAENFADNTNISNVLSEREMNKKKVMSSEFYIFCPEDTGQRISTPMSISSDTDLDDCMDDTKLSKEMDSKENLEVETELSPAEESFLSNDGNNEVSIHNESDDLLIENEFKIKIDKHEYDSTFERCKELITNNFKCKPIGGIIEMKDVGSNNSENDSNHKTRDILNKQNNLNSLSVITLTEFLQQSIALPLRAHLKVMNNEIMRLFLLDLNLIDQFTSLRNYFFLMDGEFGGIICEELIGNLESGATPSELFNYQNLHSILDKAIGSSKTNMEQDTDKLSFIVNDVPEKFDLKSPSVFLNLCLSYKVTWPMNLILSPETLEKYGDIFKYLLKIRRISWMLEQTFRMLNEAGKLIGKQLLLSPQYRRVQLIRHKFFCFVNTLKNHITASALQASWKEFEDEMLKAKCLEEIYRKHTNYIKKILFLCMLNKSSADFYRAVENILKVIIRFYRNLKCKEWSQKENEHFYTHPRYEKLLVDDLEFEKLVKYVLYLGNKIVRRGYQEEIRDLINLINYNHYYIV